MTIFHSWILDYVLVRTVQNQSVQAIKAEVQVRSASLCGRSRGHQRERQPKLRSSQNTMRNHHLTIFVSCVVACDAFPKYNTVRRTSLKTSSYLTNSHPRVCRYIQPILSHKFIDSNHENSSKYPTHPRPAFGFHRFHECFYSFEFGI